VLSENKNTQNAHWPFSPKKKKHSNALWFFPKINNSQTAQFKQHSRSLMFFDPKTFDLHAQVIG
jgi:hypothetical protein